MLCMIRGCKKKAQVRLGVGENSSLAVCVECGAERGYPTRNMDTEESRNFWRGAEESAKLVPHWLRKEAEVA